jgi:hypothetical protein
LPPGAPGLEGRFGAAPGCVEPSLCEPLAPPFGVWPVVPDVPPVPDVLEPEAELPPPEAERLPSLSHPARRAPLSANAAAAANAVNFMFTSEGCVPSREQVMDREPSFTKVVLYTAADGRAAWREERIALDQGKPDARLSDLLPASGYQLRESPVGFRSEFHCTPKPQWVFILRGEMQIGLHDGSSRRFAAGEHFFSADVLPAGASFDPKLHGHWSAQRGPEPLVTLFLKV